MQEDYIIASVDFGATNSRIVLRKQTENEDILTDIFYIASKKTSRFIGPHGYLCENTDLILRNLLEQIQKNVKSEDRNLISVFSVSSHGSSNFICIDKNGNTVFGTPSYDHPLTRVEHEIFYEAFGKSDDLYMETATPNQSAALNWAKLLFHQQKKHPGQWKRVKHIIPLNIYIGSKLCGSTDAVASDRTQTRNHGYGENNKGNFSSVIQKMGITELFPPFKKSYDILGQMDEKITKRYGFNKNSIVIVGGHDSSIFSLIPKIIGIDKAVAVSTGTWDVIMAERKVRLEPKLHEKGLLYNKGVDGKQLRTVLFRAGRMRHAYIKQYGKIPEDVPFNNNTMKNTLSGGNLLQPAYMDGCGPYRNSNNKQNIPKSFRTDKSKFHHALALSLAIQRALAIRIASETNLPEELSINSFDKGRKLKTVIGGKLAQNYKNTNKLTISMEMLRRTCPGKMYRLNFPEPTSMAAHVLGVCAMERKGINKIKKRANFSVQDITYEGDRSSVDRYVNMFEAGVKI